MVIRGLLIVAFVAVSATVTTTIMAADSREQSIFSRLQPSLNLLLLDEEARPIITSPDAGKHLAKVLSDEPNSAPFGYYIYLPDDHTLDPRKQSPLILFLHGQGEIGNGTTNLSRVLRNGPPRMIERGEKIEAVIVSPQLTIGSWQKQRDGIDIPADLNRLVRLVTAQYNIDVNRIYITGLSLGGGGAWNYARLYADEVAAVVPVCGVGTSGVNMSDLSNIGVWAFHASGDRVVPITNSVRNINRIAGTVMGSSSDPMSTYPGSDQDYAVSRVGDQWVWQPGRYNTTGKTRFTVFSGASHNAWSRAYNQEGQANTPMWEWLFEQTRQ